MLCVSLQGDYKFINCMVNATQFHVAGLSKIKREGHLALNEARVAKTREEILGFAPFVGYAFRFTHMCTPGIIF